MPPSIQAAFLGIVQGLTEFLPVSSSAHLILARAFFNYDPDQFGLPFDVAVHVGTVLAVILYFHREVGRLMAALPLAFSFGSNRRAAGVSEEDDGRFVRLLIIGTIPAVVVGGLFGDVIEERLRVPEVAALALAAGAFAFFYVERYGAKMRDDRSLTSLEAFWIGSAQALSLVPGVSRSGATLTIAMLLGLRRVDATRFVFLLGVPAILGAAVREVPVLLRGGAGPDAAGLMLIGVVSSAGVGYLAIRFFIQYVGHHSLSVFAWYRLALAASVVVWLIAGGGA
jgi:undecaprenyl-diphosphatase